MEKEPITINVGGKTFTATRSTWERSPLIKMLLERDETVFIDRNPVVFDHVLDWLRTGKLYIKKGGLKYRRLRDDAEFYLLDDLSAYLDRDDSDYVVLMLECQGGSITMMFNVSAFKSIKASDGHLDKLVSDGISEAHYYKSGKTTPLIIEVPNLWINDGNNTVLLFLLSAPHVEGIFIKIKMGLYEALKFLFGSRIQVLKQESTGIYSTSTVFELKYSPEPYL